VELAEISVMFLKGTDKSVLVIFRVCDSMEVEGLLFFSLMKLKNVAP
jgi:hypothetical protein